MTFSPDDFSSDDALRSGAVLGEISPRGQIAVGGKDRAVYLQGLLTNDIQALGPGTGCYAAWLTPQGRLLTDLHVLESGDMILLDVPRDLVEATIQRLDQFLFSEDVQLGDLRASLEGVWIHGPAAATLLGQALTGVTGLADWPQYHNARATFGETAAVVVRVDQLGVPGYCAYLEPGRAAALSSALEAAGAVPGSRNAIEAARIEAGTPVFGTDMGTETIPLEAGIEARAISFSKGCYVGQEVIIRVMHRGQGRVAKKLMLLGVEGDPPPPGSKIYEGEREIGTVTSSASSPDSGALALAYLHRDFLAPGTRVEIAAPAGRVAATVRLKPDTTNSPLPTQSS